MSQPEQQPNQPHDLGAELRELGQQLEQTVRGALESERARQLQKDISAGLKEIGTQLQHALKSIQEDPRIQQLAERGESAVQKARESKVAHEFQEALARGVAQLNEQLVTFATRLRTDDGTDTAATGATTRLDPDDK